MFLENYTIPSAGSPPGDESPLPAAALPGVAQASLYRLSGARPPSRPSRQHRLTPET